ncbi:O-methyltransferase [Pectinatus cerevisiiphilus]|uniref:tRNA 5-hydroxyuridine methyltransferase n=1 Tax=Pectinatus cerevisiiphilus TaxID=86956 RepID=A0A4R3K9I8_9FIRM|nr:O-methyltransferase [Pectinatus cerevisiiphilus]TCS79694.1 putative O-methyltransferase YrrM [Pectinatus cerevisiiphilus]
MENLLREMREYAEKHHVPIIRDQAAKILCRIAAEKKPSRILEIGTAIGYSALLLADNSCSDTCITTLEIDEERIKTAKSFWARSPYQNNIHLLNGDAAETLKTLSGQFDFVFIDAAKGQYPRYLHAVLPLISTHGLIVSDNVLFRGYVESPEKPPRRYKTIVKRLREYIKEISESKQWSTKIYYEGDGLAVSEKQF